MEAELQAKQSKSKECIGYRLPAQNLQPTRTYAVRVALCRIGAPDPVDREIRIASFLYLQNQVLVAVLSP